MTLAELLEEYAVYAPGMWDNDKGPKGWWAVSDKTGIVAYFAREKDAYYYRLDQINHRLNR